MRHETARPGDEATQRRTRTGTLPLSTLLAVVVALAVLAAPGSMAYLQAAAASDGISFESGSASLAITAGSGGSPKVYPGVTMRVNATTADLVTNTGTVPLSLSIDVTASSASPGSLGASLNFTVSASEDGCATPGQVLWTGVAAAAQTPPLLVLDAGASRSLCVSYQLPLAAPASAMTSPATSFTLTAIGTQVQP